MKKEEGYINIVNFNIDLPKKNKFMNENIEKIKKIVNTFINDRSKIVKKGFKENMVKCIEFPDSENGVYFITNNNSIIKIFYEGDEGVLPIEIRLFDKYIDINPKDIENFINVINNTFFRVDCLSTKRIVKKLVFNENS